MSSPRALDLYCGAGGASVGYHRAGFEIVGVDCVHQKNYPFEFIQADGLTYLADHGHEYDFIHESPPCQKFSTTQVIWGREYLDLLTPTREALMDSGTPYVIENVVGAPMVSPIRLCGLMFHLRVYRHRLFESNLLLFEPEHPRHTEKAAKVGRQPAEGQIMSIAGHFANIAAAREAMGISWMKRDELAQAIPPAYTFYVGRQVLWHLH